MSRKRYQGNILNTEDGYEEMVDILSNLLMTPVNVNTAGFDSLKMLFLLSDSQIDQLLEFRKKYGNFWCDCRASDRSSLLFCSTGDCIAGSRTCRICSRGDRDRRRNRHSFSTCSTFDGRDWIDPDRAWSTGNIIYRKALHCNVSGDVSVYRETVPEAVSQKGGV